MLGLFGQIFWFELIGIIALILSAVSIVEKLFKERIFDLVMFLFVLILKTVQKKMVVTTLTCVSDLVVTNPFPNMKLAATSTFAWKKNRHPVHNGSKSRNTACTNTDQFVYSKGLDLVYFSMFCHSWNGKARDQATYSFTEKQEGQISRYEVQIMLGAPKLHFSKMFTQIWNFFKTDIEQAATSEQTAAKQSSYPSRAQ